MSYLEGGKNWSEHLARPLRFTSQKEVKVTTLKYWRISDGKDDVVIKAELPGMEKDDIEVNLSNHSLTLKGDKKRKEKVKEENYYCAERTYGSFSRIVELPSDVRGEKVKTSFTNGVLEIRLSIAEKAKPKSIKVKVEEGPTTTIGQD